jgi:uncharacterized coiled-coil DUF342 family protein
MTETPETDKLIRTYSTIIGTDAIGLASKLTLKCEELERQRDEAREQRDAFIKEIEIANERLRGKKHPDDNGIMVDGEIDIKQLLEQRDGLKSAADCASDLLYTAIAERDEAREQRDAWKAKFIQQNKDLGCEMMDPNGTIWDYAKKLQKDIDTAIAERDEARSRFNEIDLCQNAQAPCKWSLKLIAERDALAKALEECKEDSIELFEERSWWKNEPRCDYGKRYKDIENNIARADAALAAVKTTNQND